MKVENMMVIDGMPIDLAIRLFKTDDGCGKTIAMGIHCREEDCEWYDIPMETCKQFMTH